jgi:peptidoglycan biosynthesis protein MviN/MurJ (putative lipid II flippase)
MNDLTILSLLTGVPLSLSIIILFYKKKETIALITTRTAPIIIAIVAYIIFYQSENELSRGWDKIIVGIIGFTCYFVSVVTYVVCFYNKKI